tara:strand:+ start:3902 stop:4441 length:540 start_codon:yes stop_codon:yes gene_type:complete
MEYFMIDEIFKTFFYKSKIDLTKLKYTTNDKPRLAYSTKTLRKDNLIFENKDYLNSILNKGVYSLMNSYNQKFAFNIKITGIWEHEYINNDFQEDHVHFNWHFSFIIYYKGRGSTVFKNPHGYHLQSMYSKFDNYLGGYEYSPELEQGDLVIFPSILPHYVKKQSNTKTISGDLLLVRL